MKPRVLLVRRLCVTVFLFLLRGGYSGGTYTSDRCFSLCVSSVGCLVNEPQEELPDKQVQSRYHYVVRTTCAGFSASQEIARGWRMTKGISLGSASWPNLFERSDFFWRFELYVQVKAIYLQHARRCSCFFFRVFFNLAKKYRVVYLLPHYCCLSSTCFFLSWNTPLALVSSRVTKRHLAAMPAAVFRLCTWYKRVSELRSNVVL